nr:hypothetical protein CFP56_78023 [Quercus suber]
MDNLASTYGYQGRWKEAVELHSEVLATRTKVLETDHPATRREQEPLKNIAQEETPRNRRQVQPEQLGRSRNEVGRYSVETNKEVPEQSKGKLVSLDTRDPGLVIEAWHSSPRGLVLQAIILKRGLQILEVTFPRCKTEYGVRMGSCTGHCCVAGFHDLRKASSSSWCSCTTTS